MKKILLSAAILALTASLFAQKKPDDVAKFTSESINVGKFKQNATGVDSLRANVVFTVTNISKEPLIIANALATCGCTIGDYTKEPIAPGKTGKVYASFNAVNLGHFDKTLNVEFAGITDKKPIKISGDVITAEEFAKLSPAEVKEYAKALAKPAKKS